MATIATLFQSTRGRVLAGTAFAVGFVIGFAPSIIG